MIIHHVFFMAASIKCLASPIVIDESLANEWLSWITDCVKVANGWRCDTIIVRVKLDSRSPFDKHLNNEMLK